MANPPEAECAVCKKITTKHCSHCGVIDNEGNIVPTGFYCSEACQQQDWKEHKLICVPAVRLYRGAKLLQEVFYLFRRTCFDMNLTGIKKDGNTIHFYEAFYGPRANILYDFPDRLVSSPEDKKALLTYNACDDVLVHLLELSRKVFKGITCPSNPPEEIHVNTKQSTKLMMRHSSNGSIDKNDYLHSFYLVKMKNGDSYVVDPAGAQFRQYSPVLPAATYEKAYVARCNLPRALGYQASVIDKDMNKSAKFSPLFPGNFSDERIMPLQKKVAQALNRAVNTWEVKAGKTVSEMLKGTKSVFEREQKELLSSIDAQTRGFVASLKSEGVYGI